VGLLSERQIGQQVELAVVIQTVVVSPKAHDAVGVIAATQAPWGDVRRMDVRAVVAGLPAALHADLFTLEAGRSGEACALGSGAAL
jgi:hypothetical protein